MYKQQDQLLLCQASENLICDYDDSHHSYQDICVKSCGVQGRTYNSPERTPSEPAAGLRVTFSFFSGFF